MHSEKQLVSKLKEKNAETLKASLTALRKESTVQLVRRIVESSDKPALRVLMEERKLFQLKGERPLLLPEFLLKMRERLAPPEQCDIYDCDLADCAYDLTLLKYINFPDETEVNGNRRNSSLKGSRVDCRNYYRPFLCLMEGKIKKGAFVSQAEEEFTAGQLLNKLVWKAFLFSKLECRRSSLFSVRYNWEVNGVRFTLWYPSYMTAKEFREWLDAHFRDIHPDAPNEQKRLQAIIDANLKRGYNISLDVPGGAVSKLHIEDEPCSLEVYDGYGIVKRLADIVAQEKVENMHELRPSIKALGGRTLKRLILQIFSDLSSGDYETSRLADQYSISRSTYSRFAGSKWLEKKGDDEVTAIPDLWRNTAQVLRGNPVFMETVLICGVAGGLEEVLDLIERERGSGNDK